MARLTIISVVLALLALVLVVELMRRRRLREKYSVIWLVVVGVTIVLALFPPVLTRASELIGIQTPSNLLFLVSILTLFAVSLQLSGEVGQLEEQTRRLAEEVGALHLRVDDLEPRSEALDGNIGTRGPPPAEHTPGTHSTAPRNQGS